MASAALPECEFTFRPLAVSENPLAKNLPGVRYRRSLKLRIVSDANLARLAGFSRCTRMPSRNR